MGKGVTKNIAIIGAGQIGSRHLQALAKIQLPVSLDVVDCNPNALPTAQKRYLQIPSNKNIQSIRFLCSIDELSRNIDLCIISTNANVRFEVFKELTTEKEISYIILEKIVFQSQQQFTEAKDIMLQKKISCWVNFPRRMYRIYNQLKDYFDENDKIKCTVTGGSWGLACNGIHFIDILAFFAHDTIYKLDNSKLDPNIWKSKRAGFVEVTGKLTGDFSKGSSIELDCANLSQEPKIITLNTSRIKLIIDEGLGIGKIATSKNRWKEDVISFKIPLQSELTHLAANEILNTGTCNLTCYDDGMQLHLPFLEVIKQHIETTGKGKYDYCPIT